MRHTSGEESTLERTVEIKSWFDLACFVASERLQPQILENEKACQQKKDFSLFNKDQAFLKKMYSAPLFLAGQATLEYLAQTTPAPEPKKEQPAKNKENGDQNLWK
jgi:hypothetical protein